MSYGAGRERRKRLRQLGQITRDNADTFLRLAADQFTSDYANIVNDRASERETNIDRDFLTAVANKNFTDAFDTFRNDVNRMNLGTILSGIVQDQTDIDYNVLPEDIKEFLRGTAARGMFFESARAGIRRLIQAPLQMGLSRTVLQKYLQA